MREHSLRYDLFNKTKSNTYSGKRLRMIIYEIFSFFFKFIFNLAFINSTYFSLLHSSFLYLFISYFSNNL